LFGGSSAARPTVAAADSATAAAATVAGGAAAPAVTGAAADLIRQAQQHYDRAIAAQRAGDWAAYGREIDQLGTILGQLRARKP